MGLPLRQLLLNVSFLSKMGVELQDSAFQCDNLLITIEDFLLSFVDDDISLASLPLHVCLVLALQAGHLVSDLPLEFSHFRGMSLVVVLGFLDVRLFSD